MSGVAAERSVRGLLREARETSGQKLVDTSTGQVEGVPISYVLPGNFPATARALVGDFRLALWRLASGHPDDDAPIVGPMSASAIRQWAWKHLTPTVKRVVGREDVTRYTLRHTHASALHYCGWTVPAAARRLGHSGPLHLRTYAHVIDALEGKPRYADLDALIEAAPRSSARHHVSGTAQPEFHGRSVGTATSADLQG